MDEKRLERTITFRLSTPLYDSVIDHAEAAGVSAGEAVRQLLYAALTHAPAIRASAKRSSLAEQAMRQERHLAHVKEGIDAAVRMWHETANDDHLRTVAELMVDVPRHQLPTDVESHMRSIGLIK